MSAMSTAWMATTVTMSANPGGEWWAYALLALAVTASWAGVPAIGSAAVGAAAVGASQGTLDLDMVIIISFLAGELGGVLGYAVGNRWGDRLITRPGKRQVGRQQLLEKGERAYAKWGRLAVFFTPAVISGTAKMKFGQFAVWNGIASLAFTLSVALTTYGAGRVTTGHHNPKDFLALALGLILSALLTLGLVRRHRRHKLRPQPTTGSSPSAS
jgi:membrane protein DedA with SNARE-associated domain